MAKPKKITSSDQLDKIRIEVDNYRARYKYQAMICNETSCQASESNEIKTKLISEIEKHHLTDSVLVIETGCMGFCAVGPLMRVFPGDYFYQSLTSC